MTIRKVLLVSIILVIALTLTACGGGKDSDDKTSDDSGVKLPQSIDIKSDAMGVSATVKYPDGWFAQADDASGTVIVSSDEAAISASEAPENAGLVMISFVPPEMASSLSVAADAAPIDVLKMQMESVAGEGEIGEPTEITVNGVKMAQVEIKDPAGDGEMLIAKQGDVFVMATCMASPGKLGDYKDTFAAIVASVTVSK